jgi:hypothetical protein
MMTEKIRRIHTVNYGVYGIRKVDAERCRNGDQVASCTAKRPLGAVETPAFGYLMRVRLER